MSASTGSESDSASRLPGHIARKATKVSPVVAVATLGVVFGDIGTSPL